MSSSAEKTIISDALIGRSTGVKTFDYTWRDVIIYALGVGAKEKELNYLYEKQLQMIPSFAAIPYWGTFGITPYSEIPKNAMQHLELDITGSLHMSHEVVIHRPLDPMGERLTFEDKVSNVYNWGEKGAVIQTELCACDASGEKVFTNYGQTFCPRFIAPSCPALPNNDISIPERAPDYSVEDEIPRHQSMIYRMSGDTNRSHVDYDFAVSLGHPRQLLQGLCTFGYACRMAVGLVLPGQPQRVTRFGGQIRSSIYPPAPICLELWKIGDHKAAFRLVNLSSGKAAFDKGYMEWN